MGAVDRVLLISIDTLRSDCLGLNPDKRSLRRFDLKKHADTPTLDGLCARGTYFPNCYATAPYTTASHGSMLTGRWTVNHGIREYFRTPLSEDVSSLFSRFKQAGHVTILATDFPTLLGPILGFSKDVDHYVDEDDGQLTELLHQHRDEPVFCFWHFATVHAPYGIDSLEADGPRFREEVCRVGALAGVAEPARTEPDWILENNRSQEERALRMWYYESIETLYRAGRYDTLMDLYISGIDLFDRDRLARAVESLRSAGWLDDSLIAVTADHGEEYSGRGCDHFDSIWHGVMNVPLTLIGPGIAQNRIDDELIRNIDIAPTLLDLAGLPLDPPLDGISLRARLEQRLPLDLVARGEGFFGSNDAMRDFLNACCQEGHLQQDGPLAKRHLVYARDGRWKLMIERDLETGRAEEFLFDCRADVGELVDLKDKYPRAAESLRRELEPYLSDSVDSGTKIDLSGMTGIADGLMDMGYLRPKPDQ